MRPRLRFAHPIALTLVLACGTAGGPGATARELQPGAPPATRQLHAAYLLLDLKTGRRLAEADRARLNDPVLPGSVMKIVALLAGFESGAINDRTRLVCLRSVTVGGHRLVCAHPDLSRPLTSDEALAHSCNSFFATVAQRIPRGMFDRTLIRLGLPALAAGATVPEAALGLGGIEPTPTALLEAFVRLTARPPRMTLETAARRALTAGLRGAVAYGTAAPLRDARIDALAKTGTTRSRAGGYNGIIVAVSPADVPAYGIVAVVPGGAGVDAADVAADVLRVRTTGQPAVAPSATEGDAARRPASPSRAELGDLRVAFTRRDGRRDLLVLPLEDYVARVVAGEAAPRSEDAALGALSITVRSYTMANLGRHAAEGFDFCDLTHCQVTKPPTSRAIDAVRSTAGRVLTLDRRVLPAFYSAACGGRTESGAAVWPALDRVFARPLTSQRDEVCIKERRWQAELDERSLKTALVSAGMRGTELRSLRVLSRTPSGRVAALGAAGLIPSEISGEAFRFAVGRTLGWQYVKSTAFDLARTAQGYRFSGTGRGHGVGFCITGAARRAARGATAEEILAAYFPGVSIERIAATRAVLPVTASRHAISPKISIELPVAEEQHRSRIASEARKHLVTLSGVLGVPQPATLMIRFHPTQASYARTTGRPWWTAAVTSGGRIEMLPPSVLRARGIFESTLRHELTHVFTSDALRGRPLWVREGVAAHFAGERPAARPSPLFLCPNDSDFTGARSADALRDAYTRAGVCVEQAMAKGTDWRHVGER
ncbi:MAG: SpoIID/LytB domain-containing protein [Acidobacteria bacterium]|nr:SpoIID/LytB domain-containing protein [Acidobacteriota bacterium]